MQVKINNQEYYVEGEKTILEVAHENNIKIPTLCFLKEINEIGACRVCVVEVKNSRNLVASCVTKVHDGMEIFTDSKRVIDSRKRTLKLILDNHNYDCINCRKNGSCELQKLINEYNIEIPNKKIKSLVEINNSAIIRDNSKCILCNRCVATCEKIQGIGAIGRNDRGIDTHIGCEFEIPLENTNCVKCGQCINVCPTGALTEKDDIKSVCHLLSDKSKHTIVAFAPAVRVALGEEFGLEGNTIGKMVTALKMLGFSKVFDVNLTADLTIVEEANELIERLKENKRLPLFTSCCPAWIVFQKKNFPEIEENISTCKSPQQMFGAIMKTYYANKNSIIKDDVKVVTIMPCTAKKEERNSDDNIDFVLTTRELARLIKNNKIDFNSLEESECDPLFGEGHSVIFGTSGGVMEAALRTAKEILEGRSDKVEFKEVRGLKGFKEAKYTIAGIELNVAVVSGLLNVRSIIKDLKNNLCHYQFIEVMSCPGGCLNGGGQPTVSSDKRNFEDYRANRMNLLYDIDNKDTRRRAHENETIKQIYKEFLDKPGSKKAREILHTK